MYMFLMTRLYPISKDKTLNVSSFTIQNCVNSSNSMYKKIPVNLNICNFLFHFLIYFFIYIS